jgi:hypothetical protein
MIGRDALYVCLVVMCVFSLEALCLGTDYYVDAAGGNDGNSGLGPMVAWRTIAKINASSFAPGDRILLKRGLLWREQLVVPSSGTADQPVVFGAYGAGERPLLKGSALVQNWTDGGSGNVWRASLRTQPNQVFFNQTRGTLQDSVQDLDSALEWCWSSGVLYVYATSNPDDLYRDPGVEASIRPSPRNYGLIHIKDSEHVTVQSIAVSQSYSYGIYIRPWGRHITISDCEVSHSLDGGIVVPNSGGAAVSQVTLLNCLVHHNNGGFKEGRPGVATYHEGVTMELVDGFAIRRCSVYNNYMEGVNFKRGATNGVIEHCSLYANGLINQYIEGASNIEIRYNKIYDCTYNAGIEIGLETNTFNNDNIRIHHNLFWGNSGAVSFWAANVSTQTRNVHICNNTFFNNEYAIRWKPGATNHCGGANSFRNNLIWQHKDWYTGIRDETMGDQGIARTDIRFNVFQQGAGSDTVGVHALVLADPHFVNASDNDFHLEPGSACINAGTDLGLEQDFEGNRIPQGAAPDIGAYERVGPASASIKARGNRTHTGDVESCGDTGTRDNTATTGWQRSGPDAPGG